MIRLIVFIWLALQFGVDHLESQIYLEYKPYIASSFSTELAYEETDLKAMIVPHHVVPLDKINKLYETASNEQVKHIVLLSPDHFTTSNRPVLTTTKDYYGDFGYLKTNQLLTETFLSHDFVYEDTKEIKVEHGLMTHIPLIKYYFPNADVTVLAISKQVKKKDLDQLLMQIPKDAFVIGSVDFSHYYNLKEATTFDEYTEALILSGGYEQFFGMSDAYFDSPGVLYILLKYAERNTLETTVYDHSNSAYYFNSDIHETTSYYFIGFNAK